MSETKEQRRCLGCMEMYISFDNICPHCGYVNDSPPEEMYHLYPGTILDGRYLIGKVIGFGGFGITYIGWDQKLLRKVAIKEYLPGECATRIPGDENITVFEGEKEEQFQKGIVAFIEEARKLMQFQNYAAIVNVYDCFEANGTAYLIMEYLEGKTLQKFLEEKKRLNVDETLEIILPIIDDLQKIHETGIIHRDIAPDNIFITEEGMVKLLDFGSARFVALAQSKSLSVIIKAGYAPPEQYQSKGNQGSWTDVYSLAATMYRMLTGVTPEEALERMAEDHLLPPSKLGAKLLKNQETALLNALNTSVESRTKTLEEFKEQFLSMKTVMRQKDEHRSGQKMTGKKLFRTGIITAAVLCVIVAGLFGSGIVRLGGNTIEQKIDYSSGLVGNYKGFFYDDVKKDAKANGISLEVVNTANDSNGTSLTDDTIGKILSQTPEAGTSLEDCDGKIRVVISAGTKQSQVQDYRGYTLEEAQKMAEKNNISLVEKQQEEGNVPAGYVLAQAAQPGEKIARDSVLEVTVSSGRAASAGEGVNEGKTFKMPSLSGKTFEKALKLAEKYGFLVGIQDHQYNLKEEKGTICAQTVSAKTDAADGTEVLVTISDGPEQMKVPDVIGQALADATKTMEKQKLKVTTTEAYNDAYGSQYEEGTVMAQSVKGGTTVDEGSEITLTISRGAEPEPVTTAPSSSGSSSGNSGGSSSSSGGGSGSSNTKKKSEPKKKKSNPKEYKGDWENISPN